MGLEPGDGGHVFALVALDALDEHLGLGFGLGRAGFGRERFGFFLQGVLFRALLGVDGEGGERGRYRGCCGWRFRVRYGMEKKRERKWIRHLRSRGLHAFQGARLQAILCIFSLYRRIRNTSRTGASALRFLAEARVGIPFVDFKNEHTSGGKVQTC